MGLQLVEPARGTCPTSCGLAETSEPDQRRDATRRTRRQRDASRRTRRQRDVSRRARHQRDASRRTRRRRDASRRGANSSSPRSSRSAAIICSPFLRRFPARSAHAWPSLIGQTMCYGSAFLQRTAPQTSRATWSCVGSAHVCADMHSCNGGRKRGEGVLLLL